MLKNLALAALPLSLILFIACSGDVDVAGGGTIDPNANRGINAAEPNSSSSVSSENDNGLDVNVLQSSSSKDVARSSSSKEKSSSSKYRDGSNNLNPNIDLSSSSSDNGDRNVPVPIPDVQSSSSSQDTVVFTARNFSAQCIIDYVKVDPAELVPVTDEPDATENEPVAAADVLGASAYKSVDGDSVNIYLDGAYLNTPCDSAEEVQFFEEINSGNKIPVGLVNDTLSMTLRWDKTCACAATVSFTLDKPSKDFNYIIFDLWRPIPFLER